MTGRVLLFSFLLIALSGLTKAQGTNTKDAKAREEDKREVMKLEDEQNAALMKGNTDAIRRLWPDDFAYTTARGNLLSRDEIISDMKAGKRKYYTIEHVNIEVHDFGNTIVLRGRSTSKVLSDGQVSSGPRTFVDIFAKQNGKWQSVAHAANPVVAQ